MATNRGAFTAVIYILGAALLLCVAGVCVLAAIHVPLPDLLKEIGVGALAGLGGMLTHPPTTDVQPVVVQQPQDQPVPVDPQGDAGHAGLEHVLLTALAIALGLILWSLIGAHTDLF